LGFGELLPSCPCHAIHDPSMPLSITAWLHGDRGQGGIFTDRRNKAFAVCVCVCVGGCGRRLPSIRSSVPLRRPQLACTAALGSWTGRIVYLFVYLFLLSEFIILLFDVHVQERRWSCMHAW
jgi:hypothetical protein